jgi:hypothetical protein
VIGRVVWKWEDEDEDGEGVGPVWVDTFADGDARQPSSSEGWDRWVRRSEATRFADQHGFEFIADE